MSDTIKTLLVVLFFLVTSPIWIVGIVVGVVTKLFVGGFRIGYEKVVNFDGPG